MPVVKKVNFEEEDHNNGKELKKIDNKHIRVRKKSKSNISKFIRINVYIILGIILGAILTVILAISIANLLTASLYK